jgi:hypothetical protein
MTIWSILLPSEILYGHLVYFTGIGNIVWPFGIFCGHLVFFSRFGILYKEKSDNPVLEQQPRSAI